MLGVWIDPVTAQVIMTFLERFTHYAFRLRPDQVSGQVPDFRTQRQKLKVFWFFSSEKNKTLLFLKKKKQKDFYFLVSLVQAYGIWPGAAVMAGQTGRGR